MYAKLFTAVVVAAATTVSAQTFTECNPLEKTCPADPAFGGSAKCDFTKGKCDDVLKGLAGTSVTYDDQGAVFSIKSAGQAPTMKSDKYLFFGRVDVEMRAAPEKGIVTSIVLQSDDRDEIDWEFVGSDNAQVQTNYFSKGDDSVFNRGAFHPVSDPIGTFHTYSIEWTPTQLNWIIDGKVVRTLNAADAHGSGAFPQSPMQVRLGTWIAGHEGAPPGTIQWAGGVADMSKAPFNAWYKSLTIVDYAGGSKPANGGVKEYVYGDHSGLASSIKVVRGDGTTNNADSGNADSSASSSAASSVAAVSSSAAASSTEVGTSTAKTSVTSKTSVATTMTTAAASSSFASNGTTSAITSAPAESTAASTTSSGAPATTSMPVASAPRSAAGLAGALLAGAAVVFAQLL